ncbi:MAG: M16 family metallopeptidase [Puniceicoccaceae bacterium]
MMHRRPAIAALFMILASLPSAAETSFPWPHENSDLRPDPAIRFGSLPNGMGYLIRRSPEPPGRVSVRLVFQAGSLMETEEQRGLAHFLEHMAFNGTRNFPAGEMVEYFQRLGMAFGADTNASTGFDRTAYQLELPRGDASLREESLRLLRDYADGILFESEEIEKERGIILAEKASRDSVDFRTFEAEIGFLLPETRFASRMPIGVTDVIETLPREEFVEFYERWYHPARTFVVVTGDMDPEEWEAAIRETFATYGKDRPEEPVPPGYGPVSFGGVEARVHREPEAKGIRFELSTGAPLGDEPDTTERRLREGQLQILNSILSRRLERIAREEDSPILESYAYTTPFFEFVEFAGLAATVQPEQWKEAVGIIDRELRRALEHGFAESEILEAESNFLKAVRQRVAGQDTRPTPEWADEYAHLINAGRVPVSPGLELELAEQAAAVSTPGTLLELLREIWERSGRRLFLAGPVPEGVDDAALLAAYEASRAEPVEAPAVLDDLVFPYGAEGAVGPAEQRVVEDPGVTQARYPNGVRANWKRTEFEEDVIVVSVRAGGGELTLPPDRPGLARFAEGAFVEGGLGEISFDDLRTVTAGREVSVRLTVDGNAFVLQGKTRPEDLELQMDLLRAYLLDPGLRPEGESVFRRSIAPMFRELRSTWRGVLQSRAWPFLYGRFGVQDFPTEEELRERGYAELREWLLPQLAEEYLEISVVGDFEEEALRASLDRVFGTLPGDRPERPRHAPGGEGPRFPAGEERDFRVESDIPQGAALVAFPSTGIAPVERSRTLSLLASVLDDRLRLRIREETGQAYSYTAANRTTDVPDFGIFFAVAILSPEKVEPVARRIQEIASSLTDSPVTGDERERALAPTLRQLEDMRRNNGYWIRVIGGSQNRPEQLEWSKTLLDGYADISLDDLNRAAEEFIRPGKAAVVRIRSD